MSVWQIELMQQSKKNKKDNLKNHSELCVFFSPILIIMKSDKINYIIFSSILVIIIIIL